MKSSRRASEYIAVRRTLTLPGAKAVAATAEKAATKAGHSVCIAIVDDGGDLVFFQKSDGSTIASIAVAIAKARTAARYRCPTKTLQDIANDGKPAMLALPEALMLEGGEPLMIEGGVVGAIGVSGVNGPVEGKIARLAASTLR